MISYMSNVRISLNGATPCPHVTMEHEFSSLNCGWTMKNRQSHMFGLTLIFFVTVPTYLLPAVINYSISPGREHVVLDFLFLHCSGSPRIHLEILALHALNMTPWKPTLGDFVLHTNVFARFTMFHWSNFSANLKAMFNDQVMYTQKWLSNHYSPSPSILNFGRGYLSFDWSVVIILGPDSLMESIHE